MAKKLDYAQLINDMMKADQYGIESIELEDIGQTIQSWDFGLPTLHIPDHRLKISLRGHGDGECTATFRGPYIWRNCYRFIKAAHKHL